MMNMCERDDTTENLLAGEVPVPKAEDTIVQLQILKVWAIYTSLLVHLLERDTLNLEAIGSTPI